MHAAEISVALVSGVSSSLATIFLLGLIHDLLRASDRRAGLRTERTEGDCRC